MSFVKRDMALDPLKIRKLIGDRSQDEVARVADIHRVTLNKMLAGKHDPRLNTLERLAAALGVKVRDILKDTPTRKKGEA
jgi:transcriptional regulator with XRE-family HTH domain